jgi:hypothetical protein
LLIPATIAIGAVIGIGVMLGAVAVHLFILGIAVQGDGGQLFIYALLVLVSCIILLLRYKEQLYTFKKLLNR